MDISLNELKNNSNEKIKSLRAEVYEAVKDIPYSAHVCIFACGSLGRQEFMPDSDLDLFFIWDDDTEEWSTPEQNHFIDSLLDLINYDPRDKKYKVLIKKEKLLDIGSHEEDYYNSFTARMLLLLESKPIFNEKMYYEIIDETIGKYFVDYGDHASDFCPLFLMNDIQRYWLTLLLNYEYRRDPNDAPNKKYWKRLKLKYARLITCYSLIACLYESGITEEFVKECVLKTPFERIDYLGEKNQSLKSIIDEIYKQYDKYLKLRNENLDYWEKDGDKVQAMRDADCFHDILIHNFMNSIASVNEDLHKKTEVY